MSGERGSKTDGRPRNRARRSLINDEQRFRLIGGPYTPPAVRVGHSLECARYGRVVVTAWSRGRIAWPMTRITSSVLILCGDFERAIRLESSEAVCHWFGVSRQTVSRCRKALGVQRINQGTRVLMREWAAQSLPAAQRAVGQASARATEVRRRAVETRRRNPHPNWGATPRYPPWTPEEDALLGTRIDREVGALLDYPAQHVRRRRLELGIAAFDSANSTRYDRSPDLVTLSPQKLLARRLALGLMQKELCRRCGFTAAGYSQMETGARRRVRRTTLNQLARALDCPAQELIEPHGIEV